MKIETPKPIWMFWAQVWDQTPALLNKCKRTWVEAHSDWAIHFLNSENLSEYIDLNATLPGYQAKNIPTVSLSNVIRLALLLKYSGVWFDATVFKLTFKYNGHRMKENTVLYHLLSDKKPASNGWLPNLLSWPK